MKFKSRKTTEKVISVVLFLVLMLGAIIMVAPLVWMFTTALKTKLETYALPPILIPPHPNWGKFQEIWVKGNGSLIYGIKNSLIVAITCTTVGSFTSSLAAFSFAKLHLPGKKFIFLMLLGTLMIPFPVVMIPQFVMFSKIGWVGTLLPLIVPGLFGNVMMIFFLRQYLTGVPDELIEAAKIDGCSIWRIYRVIILPLIKPAVVAQVILWFMYLWNDFLNPSLYLNDPKKLTLQLVIANFNATYQIQTDYPLIMAASFVAMIPMLFIFMIFQKQIVESVALAGIKG